MKLQDKNLVMVYLNNFIKVYDNCLDENFCKELIKKFENLSEVHERVENNFKPNFTQINLTKLSSDSMEMNYFHQYIIKKTFEYKKIYYSHIKPNYFPEENDFEQFRVKRYLNDGNDMFDMHVDVMNHSSSKRFLSFLWYLNDVDTGGETVFNGMVIQPKAGKLVIFPPLWLFPHAGKPPVSNNKYIMSTYLHYK